MINDVFDIINVCSTGPWNKTYELNGSIIYVPIWRSMLNDSKVWMFFSEHISGLHTDFWVRLRDIYAHSISTPSRYS